MKQHDLFDNRLKGALISEGGIYRYSLWRIWNEKLPPALWVMLNPSTADADTDDPTIRKIMTLTKRQQSMGGIIVLNLFALRATDPAALLGSFLMGLDPVGAENDAVISREARRDCIPVAGWGAFPHSLRWRIEQFLAVFSRPHIWSFGITQDGQPSHPLYLPNDAEMKIWRSISEGSMRHLSWFAQKKEDKNTSG
jgi:hypothetical protein